MRSTRATAVLVAMLCGIAPGCGSDEASDVPPATTDGDVSPTDGDASTDASTGAECPPGGCNVESELRLPYVQDAANSQKADVYWPAEPGAWPIVVLAHGLGGGRSDVMPLARELASHGVVAMTVSYPDAAPFLESRESLGCAVRFARSIAGEYGGDPNVVTYFGHSLGAAMGVNVALDHDVATDGCLATEGSTSPDALVGYEGPYDIATFDYRGGQLRDRGTEHPEVWDVVDPYANVGGNLDISVRLVHGVDEGDRWFDVPVSVSEDFHQTLRDAGYDVELVLIDGASHDLPGPNSAGFDELVTTIIATTDA